MTQTYRLAALAIVFAALCPFTVAEAQFGQGIKVETEWTLEADKIAPGESIRAALEVHLEKPYHVHSNKPLEDYLIPTILTVTPPEGLSVAEIVYPEPIELMTNFSEIPLAVFEERFVVGVVLKAAEDAAAGSRTVPVSLRYQACDDEKCLPPKTRNMEIALEVVNDASDVERVAAAIFDEIAFGTGEATDTAPSQPVSAPEIAVAPVESEDVLATLAKFDVLATAGGYLEPDEFIAFIDEAETGVPQRGTLEGLGPIAIITLVIVGGLALNLTPCVLPLIPINLAIIGAGAQAGSRGRGFALGATYGLAMAIVYGVLGLIVVLTAGTFGAINSTIWFNVGIAALFVVLGLAMFDVIAIDFTKWQTKLNLTGKAQKGTFALAFGMGAIAALLAGACVAPVVIQVIVYSGDQFARGNQFALALPFLLGIGMALPWPFAGAGLSFLPKPGPWMVRVKQAMGLFILGFAAYYGYLAYEIWDNRRVDPEAVSGMIAEQVEEGGWVPSLSAGLTQGLAEDKPVLIDMWATWCKNCLVMDKTTFKDEEVLARLDGYVKVKFQAEDLERSPQRQVLERLDGIGLPTYGILAPKSDADAPESTETD